MSDELQELNEWLTEKKKLDQPIAADLDLIESGLMDSLLFAEYVMMIEDLSGIEIEVDDELVERVRTLAQVENYYFNGGEAAATAAA